jgi:cellulose synthase/poly-beta-1,6-N-acetylglucosamine synthase-like glycosyltransferase
MRQDRTMTTIVSYLLIFVAGLLAILVAVLVIEITAAVRCPPRCMMRAADSVRRRVAVLVPAHNESKGLLPTLVDIQNQLIPGDRLLVIADNCNDDTADVARAAGAEVIERHDMTTLGKGYALEHGLRHLSFDPPEIVIVIDADCRVKDCTVDQLAWACTATGQPVQALNVMTSPNGSLINHRVAEFAGRVKRWLRPLGLNVLRLPCQLSGTGMAFPYAVLRLADLTTGGIAEDVKLGLELSLVGYPPTFCPSACVTSEFPFSIKGTKTQRKRWEQGHINLIAKEALRLLWHAVAHRNWNLLALTLDLAVPPLSLLITLIVVVFMTAIIAVLFGLSVAPLFITTASLFGLLGAIFLAWLKCGRDILPATSFWSLVPYVTGKLGLYGQILVGRKSAQWDRTDRQKP